MVMDRGIKTGAPLLGIVFLALAFLKLLQGKPWVVWAILAVLFGALRLFAAKAPRDSQP
jgi:hypothetical protein